MGKLFPLQRRVASRLALLSSISIASTFLLLASPLHALSVKPGAQVIRVVPGKTMLATFEITNDQEYPIIVTTSFRDSFVLEKNKGKTVSQWLKPKFEKLTIAPKQTVKADFNTQMPKDVKGELAALISFIPDSQEPKNEKESQPKDAGGIQTKIVTLITVSLYVRAKGTEIGEADVSDIRLEMKPIQGQDPASLQATIVVQNKGNIHLRPSGNCSIFRAESNEKLFNFDFPSGWPVMPESEYPYLSSVPGTLVQGKYELRCTSLFGEKTSISKNRPFTVNDKEQILY